MSVTPQTPKSDDVWADLFGESPPAEEAKPDPYEDIRKENSDLLQRTNAQWNNLSESEQKAVFNYTESSRYINPELGRSRGDTSQLMEHARTQVRLLDSAIEKGVLPKQSTIYRAVNLQAAGFDAPNSLVGKVIVDHAYGSATIDEGAALLFSGARGKTLLKVDAPSGTRGLYLGNGADRSANNESEFLMPRSVRYHVVSHTQVTRPDLYSGKDIVYDVLTAKIVDGRKSASSKSRSRV